MRIKGVFPKIPRAIEKIEAIGWYFYNLLLFDYFIHKKKLRRSKACSTRKLFKTSVLDNFVLKFVTPLPFRLVLIFLTDCIPICLLVLPYFHTMPFFL